MIEWEPQDQFIGTTAALIGLATASATAGASIYSAKTASGAARDAANLQVAAANRSAELQAQAAQQALEFQRAEAARDQQNFARTQLANYGQYAADEQNQYARYSTGEVNRNKLAPWLGGIEPRDIAGNFIAPPPDWLRQQAGLGGPPAAGGGGATPDIQAFIANYQQTHPVSEGIGPLAAAIKAKYPTVSRYMYGQTPSNNELNIGGEKYKVLGGEGGPGAYWYSPGMDDSAPTAGRRYSAPTSNPFGVR